MHRHAMALTIVSALLIAFTVNAFAAPPPLRVLFVGNSQTYTHDLPRMVSVLAARRGVTLDVAMQAEPDHSLADHLGRPQFQQALQEDWDWIVLQQGPSARPASRAELIRSVNAIAAGLQGRPVRIALMSVWPQQRFRASSLAAEESYRQAAIAVGGCVFPVASAWRHARAKDTLPPLYQRDQLHATPTGSVLAALTILPGLIGAERSGLQARAAQPATDKNNELHTLETIAWRAYREEPQRCEPMPTVGGQIPK